MTSISLVVAVSRNSVIGKDGDLPWRLPSDLKKFKAITMGKPVIMGRKTWDSLPRKPLPGRLNIVVSRDADLRIAGAETVANRDQALALTKEADEVCVIGGGEIYRMFLPVSDTIYRSVVDLMVEGDTRFPEIDEVQDWVCVSREQHAVAEGDSASFEFQVLKRR